MFHKWDWEDVGLSILAAAAIFVVILVALVSFSPKNVDYYYISTGASGGRPVSACAYAHWTWHTDEIAYCSDDVNKVLDFTAKANATLKK